MAKKAPEHVAPAPAPPPETIGQQMARTLAEVRAVRIREARARVPTPSYSEIAVEVGCCEKTVHNVVTGKSHARG